MLFIATGIAHADGLGDLKAALARQQGQTPIKGSLELKTWSRRGDGKDLDESNGLASITIEDNLRGMQVQYSRDVLARMETEERAREKDPKTKTPTLSALKELNTGELRGMTNAAYALSMALDKLNFKNERPEVWNGKSARVLSFDASLDRQSEKDKKYVKKFEGTAEIWIAADGTPLASRSHQNISGRAFVVISFEAVNHEEQVFSLVGDRLIVLRKEVYNSGSGAGEKGESRVTKTLQLQP
ncbi:hypothetical protein [Undibacterium sp.]|uniref:hypothetical protein n=1 Tax=Undibacterium sp. TaxID=1914977 RepID=UPI002D0DC637|nr:hypothetical protein [Undibacterium sp.]HTD03382.1 hypothetical protein [Undibacterium sp.]